MKPPSLEFRRVRRKRRIPLNRYVSALLVIIFIFIQATSPSASSASPAEILMRFFDGNTGKLLTGVQIQLDAWIVDEIDPKSEKIIKTWNGKTDKEGKLLVHLQAPLPQHLSFRSPNELRECSDERFSIADALNTGVVAKYAEKCGKLKAVATATPGQIIVFDRKYKFLD